MIYQGLVSFQLPLSPACLGVWVSIDRSQMPDGHGDVQVRVRYAEGGGMDASFVGRGAPDPKTGIYDPLATLKVGVPTVPGPNGVGEVAVAVSAASIELEFGEAMEAGVTFGEL